MVPLIASTDIVLAAADARDESGNKLGPKLGVDQPGKKSSSEHKKNMTKAGVTSGRYISRHCTTGRCTLTTQKKPLVGCKIIGRAPPKEEWIPLVLRSEESQGRLKIKLADFEVRLSNQRYLLLQFHKCSPYLLQLTHSHTCTR